MDNYTFDFLEDFFPELVRIGRNIEDLFYEDPQSVLIKGRIFSEKLSKRISCEHDLNSLNHLKQVDRIQQLEKEDIISKEIARSFDTIRYLGNKAAHEHIEGDLESAFKMHRHLFNIAVWFMEVYGSYEFVAPKYKHPQPRTSIDIWSKFEEKISISLEEKLKRIFETTRKQSVNQQNVEASREDKQSKGLEKTGVLLADIEKIGVRENIVLEEGESYLLRELSKLKESSQEAIENSNQFSPFKEYLHVKRSIQDDLTSSLTIAAEKKDAQLIFLCGSVGDGKSHLLAYINNKYPELIKDFSIHNDATESFDPQKSSLDTLAEVLKPFSDDEVQNSGHKLILAINLGVLHNFIESDYAKNHYRHLTKFIKESKIFESSIITDTQINDYFHLISFSDYQPFELTKEGPKSYYFSSLLERLVAQSVDNPFYSAYQKDKERGIKESFITNYELIQVKEIRDGIVKLLIEAIVKYKMIISTRALLNFLYDILVPSQGSGDFLSYGTIEKAESLLPNLLFGGQNRSHLLAIIAKMDPIHLRSNEIDQALIELNNSVNMVETFNRYLQLEGFESWRKELNELGPFYELSSSSKQIFNKTLIRTAFFLSKAMKETFVDLYYQRYMKYLYAFNIGNRSNLREMYDLVKESIFLWNGSPETDYVYMDKSSSTIQVAQSLIIERFVGNLMEKKEEVLNRFKLNMVLGFADKNKQNPVFLEIDYQLYEMMVKLSKGYQPNKKDKEDCIQFIEFIDKVMKLGNKDKELLFVQLQGKKTFKLTYDEDFGEFTFRGARK